MSGVIDANVLLFAANADASEHARAYAFVSAEVGGSDAWYLTDGIVYEFLRLATHANIFERPLSAEQGVRFLRALWNRDNVMVLTPGVDHWTTLAATLPHLRYPTGNLFFDIRTYVLMREHGIRTIYTANTEFHQFEGIRVMNPIA